MFKFDPIAVLFRNSMKLNVVIILIQCYVLQLLKTTYLTLESQDFNNITTSNYNSQNNIYSIHFILRNPDVSPIRQPLYVTSSGE